MTRLIILSVRRALSLSALPLALGLASCGGGGGEGSETPIEDDPVQADPTPTDDVIELADAYDISATTSEAAPDPNGGPAEALMAGDFDGNGRRDVLVPLTRYRSSDTSKLPAEPLMVDDEGALIRQENGLAVETGWVQDALPGHFDQDTRLDAFFGDHGVETSSGGINPGATNKLFLGSVNGLVIGPSSDGANRDTSFWHSTRTGDIDGDGDLDLVAVNTQLSTDPQGRGLQVFLNDGSGVFTRDMSWVPADADATVDGDYVVTVTDVAELTGDSHPDLVVGFAQDFGGTDQHFDTRIYAGDGSSFADSPTVTKDRPNNNKDLFTDKINTGDLNGDGRQDIMVYFADLAGSAPNRIQLLYQQPDGSYEDRTVAALGGYELESPTGYPGGASVEIVDINGDGRNDLHWTFGLLPSPSALEETLFINRGGGEFARLSELAPGAIADEIDLSAQITWVRFVDADGDGKRDLLLHLSEKPGEDLMSTFGLLRRKVPRTTSGEGDDTITGSIYPDRIEAGPGDDEIHGSIGGDRINGGAGRDRTIYEGKREQFTVTGNAVSATVTRDGVTDQLLDVEEVHFADETLTLGGGNAAPVVEDDRGEVVDRQPVTVDVLDNDRDPDGDTLTVTEAVGTQSGSLAINGDGSITYQPSRQFNGVDTFFYQVSDGQGASNQGRVTISMP